MVYKWVKTVLLLAALVSLVCVLALALGYMGLQRTPMVLQLSVFTTGLFIFYHTRKQKVKQAALVWPVMAVHALSLPLAVLMAVAIQNETFAARYWFVANLGLVICLGVAWLLLLSALQLPRGIKALLLLLAMVYLVLLALHMCGVFANGKIIFFSGLLLFVGTVALVLFVIRKPPVKPEAHPAPVAE